MHPTSRSASINVTSSVSDTVTADATGDEGIPRIARGRPLRPLALALLCTTWFASEALSATAAPGIPTYPKIGTPNTATYTFVATDAGDIWATFLSNGPPAAASAGYTGTIGMLVNGVSTGVTGLNNQTSTFGTMLDLGHVNAGDTVTFSDYIAQLNTTWYSDSSLNQNNYNQIYSTAFLAYNGVPSGTYIGFGDTPNDAPYYNYAATQLAVSGIRAVSLLSPGSVNYAVAGPGDTAYLATTRVPPSGGSGGTISLKGLDVLAGGSYTLGTNEVLTLDNGNGTLNVAKGGVFSGNGIVNGNVINAGLTRIPIVALNQVQGGNINIPQSSPGAPISASGPVCLGCASGSAPAIYSFGGTGGGGLGGGGAAGVLTAPPPLVTVNAPSVTNQATVGVDSSLEVTGNFSQTSTGALRLFVGGNQPGTVGASKSGGTFSQLFVDKAATLDGSLQIVLQPELFSQFGYTPHVGDTFDFVVANGGITLASTLKEQIFVTQAGAAMLFGITSRAYNSGISSDPDSLLQIDTNLFSFGLVDNGTVLRGTLISALNVNTAPVPIPGPLWLLLGGTGGLGALLRTRRSA